MIGGRHSDRGGGEAGGSGVGKVGEVTFGIDTAHGDDPGIGGGPGFDPGRIVSDGGDHGDPEAMGFRDRFGHGTGVSVGGHADVDDPGPAFDRGVDALGEEIAVAEALFPGDADVEEVGSRGETFGPLEISRDERSDGGAVAFKAPPSVVRSRWVICPSRKAG